MTRMPQPINLPIKVSDVQTEKTQDLRWSLNPFLNWSKWIAVLQFPDGKKESLISLIHRYCAWFLTIGTQCSLLFTFLYWDNPHFFSSGSTAGVGNYNRVTFTWTLFINYTNKVVHSIGIHTVIMFLLIKKWKPLVISLENTENRLGLKKLDYVSVRKFSWICVFYAFLSVGFVTILLILQPFYELICNSRKED